jgi:glycosyl transferase family 25
MIPIYLINLDKSTERLKHCDALFKAHGLEFERVSAVNGAALSNDEINRHYDANANRNRYFRPLSRGEIGCYLSHRKCWQTLLESSSQYCIVLEDDVEIIGDVSRAISDIENSCKTWDVVKLSTYKRQTKAAAYEKQISQDFSLVIHKKPVTGCPATLYSRAGATQLLKHSERFFRPVDSDIQHYWEKDLIVWALKPYIFQQKLDVQSDIGTRKNKIDQKRLTKIKLQIDYFFKNKKARSTILSKISSL